MSYTMNTPDKPLDPGLDQGLRRICPVDGSRVSENATHNLFYWYHLETHQALLDAARLLDGHDARLCTITAYAPKEGDEKSGHEIAYHFEIRGAMVTVTVTLDEERLAVPSISSYFRNADWNEREFREMWGIEVLGLENEKRLFLDESLDAGVLDRVIPVSVLMNGASSKDLWERILAAKAEREA